MKFVVNGLGLVPVGSIPTNNLENKKIGVSTHVFFEGPVRSIPSSQHPIIEKETFLTKRSYL